MVVVIMENYFAIFRLCSLIFVKTCVLYIILSIKMRFFILEFGSV